MALKIDETKNCRQSLSRAIGAIGFTLTCAANPRLAKFMTEPYFVDTLLGIISFFDKFNLCRHIELM
jgi:hypothetical protein